MNMRALDPRDKNYLRLQFRNKIYEKNAIEFQTFFEQIMSYAFFNFKSVRPYGDKGDGGNDGYIPSKGEYYQVYSPKDPLEKEAEAARKFKKDFKRLKSEWGEITTIKKYYFVFNDKRSGTTIVMEQIRSDLNKENENIDFEIFTSKNLESIFFGLENDQILSLGFDIDLTKQLKLAHEYLEKLEVNFDRDNMEFVLESLRNMSEIVADLDDEDLSLRFEIIEARTLSKSERVREAIDKYDSIFKRYPNDPQAILYKAEIALNNGDLKTNDSLLKLAEKIDKNHWLLSLEKLIRSYVTNEVIDLSKIDEKKFSSVASIKSAFYRIYSGVYEKSKDYKNADSFIEKAIKLNPNRFNNYDVKLSILAERLYLLGDNLSKSKVNDYLIEIDSVEKKFQNWGGLGYRNKAVISFKRLIAFRMQDNIYGVTDSAKNCFELLIKCYFDKLVDSLFTEILSFVELPDKDLAILVSYLNSSDKKISDYLAKGLISQFILRNTLFTNGKEFFKKNNNIRMLGFINNLENNNYDKVLDFLSDDITFSMVVAGTAKGFPDLRIKIIENLPSDRNIQKDKLLLLLNYDEGNIDEAFDLVRTFDLSSLNHSESKQVLKIAEEKKAWDFVVILLTNLLNYEKDPSIKLQLKLQLFIANFNLSKFKEVCQIGEKILSNKVELEILGDDNRENLLAQTILARLKRQEFPLAKSLMEKYSSFLKSYELILGIKVEVYLRNSDAKNALKAITEGIKKVGTPRPEEYGRLFLNFVEIGNLINFKPLPMKKVVKNSFVKIKGQERWYFIGDENELDSTKISIKNEKYPQFLNKKLNDKVFSENKYRVNDNNYIIENILSIENYIHWQCIKNVQKLTKEERWNEIEMIDVPETDKGVDPKYIISRLKDDMRAGNDFFATYQKNNMPLSLLALSQGSLARAMGLIRNEQKGFINFSSGSFEDIRQQKEVAKRIIKGESFYIDGTSALILAETGLLEDIYQHMPNLMIPQSVISLLFKVKEQFKHIPGQSGQMSYSQGKLVFFSNDIDKRRRISDKFDKSISLLESNPKNIKVISAVNKSEKFSEQRVFPSLSDSCILAQRDGFLTLTEDYLYIKVNETDTKKIAPQYCSSFSFIRELYDSGKISSEKYFLFFNYLSNYRFRFLPITVEDIGVVVFGDKILKSFKPEGIRLLNFHLTLSEDYGVDFNKAFSVVGQFLLKVINDDSVITEMMDKIFVEIVEEFPTAKSKREIGEMFLSVLIRIIDNNKYNLIKGVRTQEKIDSLIKLIKIY